MAHLLLCDHADAPYYPRTATKQKLKVTRDQLTDVMQHSENEEFQCEELSRKLRTAENQRTRYKAEWQEEVDAMNDLVQGGGGKKPKRGSIFGGDGSGLSASDLQAKLKLTQNEYESMEAAHKRKDAELSEMMSKAYERSPTVASVASTCMRTHKL